jgi:hypothetical protein
MPNKENIVESIGKQSLPLAWQQFFAEQRAAPNPETGDGGTWFGDELPPTYQDYLNRPTVRQAQAIASLQMLQQIQQSEQRAMAQADPATRKAYARRMVENLRQQQG